MKKKFITMLLVCASVMSLTACGSGKNVTIDDIYTNMSTKDVSTVDATADVNFAINLALTDMDDAAKQLIGPMTEEIGLDLENGVNLNVNANAKIIDEKTDGIEHTLTTITTKIDSNSEVLNTELQDALETQSEETYVNKGENKTYTKSSDEDTWYYEIEEDETEDVETAEKVKELKAWADKYKSEFTQDAKLAEVDGKYTITYDVAVDRDYIKNLSDSKKNMIIDLLKIVDEEGSIPEDLFASDELIPSIDNYSTVNVPIHVVATYENVGDKKSPSYLLTAMSANVDVEAKIDMTADDVKAVMDEMAQESDNYMADIVSQMRFGLNFALTMNFKVDAKFGYDKASVIIPQDIIDSAVEKPVFNWSYDDYSYDEDYSDYEWDDTEWEYDEWNDESIDDSYDYGEAVDWSEGDEVDTTYEVDTMEYAD